MTLETSKHGISDFLLQVTKAGSFKELESAFQKVSTDFDSIIKKDTKGLTNTFVKRYHYLSNIAQEILQQNTNGETPTVDQLAIFGEMVALRDICFKRITHSK